ncbi:hypothetical protein [Kribbella sp. NPDC004875]|uniref:hypothetical protein n=1 Tax=Kribbella sp. NPDC004875 TaxID=3364107 RepID=UPI0036A814BE
MSLPDTVLEVQLRELGYADVEQIAIGMQGAVYRLGRERVAKIWFHAGETELRRLGELYAALDGRLPFRTPRMLGLHPSARPSRPDSGTTPDNSCSTAAPTRS